MLQISSGQLLPSQLLPSSAIVGQLVLALIMSRLDYCNSVLAALPTSTLQPLYTARSECSCPTSVRLESLRPCHADPDPAALAAGQLQNKVQAVLPRPRHPLRSQPGVCDGNSPCSQSVPADHVAGYADLPPHRWTTLYHGCARSSASGRSHMRVLPPGTLCPTTSAPWLILSSSENCRNHTILVKLLTFVDFCVFLGVLAFG